MLGNIYPMLGELGGGYGSVKLNFEFPRTQNLWTEVLPKVGTLLEGKNIGVDLPTTVKDTRAFNFIMMWPFMW